MTDTTVRQYVPLAYLEQQVGKILRGESVRDLDEAFGGVRAEIERLRSLLKMVATDILPHVRDTGHNVVDREISTAAFAVWEEFKKSL